MVSFPVVEPSIKVLLLSIFSSKEETSLTSLKRLSFAVRLSEPDNVAFLVVLAASVEGSSN